MSDFSKTLAAKSDQINNPDLAGGHMDVTIKKIMIKLSEVQPVTIKVEETEKFYRPSLGMRRVMAAVWGDDQQEFIGRSLRIYQDPDVNFGKDKTGGIRISHMSHIDRVMRVVVPTSRNRYKEYVIEPLKIEGAPEVDIEVIQAEAREAAGKGRDEFLGWWNDNLDKRDCAKIIMEELKKIAADADAAKAPPTDNDEEPM